MEPIKATSIVAKIYADQELREQMRKSREQHLARWEASRAAAEEFERSRPERLEAFWRDLGFPEFAPSARSARAPAEARDRERRQLLAIPPAEAWIRETAGDFLNADTCPTQREFMQASRNEYQRLRATRERLRSIGVK